MINMSTVHHSQTVSEVTELRFCSLPESPTNLSLEARYLVPNHLGDPRC